MCSYIYTYVFQKLCGKIVGICILFGSKYSELR